MRMNSYIDEATDLFARFAERHQLIYVVSTDAPVEILWEFPEQHGLSHPVVLCLSNADELSFGVHDFWSYFFPFEKSAPNFERTIDAWVQGKARIVRLPLGGRVLQLLDGGRWQTVYRANWLLPVPRNPTRTISNQPAMGAT